MSQSGTPIKDSQLPCCGPGQGRLLLPQSTRFSREANVNRGTFIRRDLLKLMGAAGAIGLPAARTFSPSVAHALGTPEYKPAARFDLGVSETLALP
jgi:hypothetical protein